MSRQAGSGHAAAGRATRGFLFADLRGYTALLERHGAELAADLLNRYRRLVRANVAEYDGAEIRTEGDSFYVVFPNASAAVVCGLAIVDAAAEANRASSGLPITVGIGVHAGETVDTDEGYVGSAVNIAARLCALADAGEVLVSDTVRALTGGVAPVSYLPRGRRRLKGVSEPVTTYRAARPGTPTSRSTRFRSDRLRRWMGITAAVVAAIALIATGVVWFGNSRADGEATSSASAAATGDVTVIVLPTPEPNMPLEPLPLHPGPHRFAQLQPSFSFVVPDEGWYAYRDYLDAAGLVLTDASENPPDEEGLHDIGTVDFGRVQVVYTEACMGADTRLLDATPNSVVEWLQSHQQLEPSRATPVNLGGYSGLQVDVELRGGAEPCPDTPDLPLAFLFPVGEDNFYLAEGEKLRVITLDVSGRPLSILLSAGADSFDEVLQRAEPLLQSLRITPG